MRSYLFSVALTCYCYQGRFRYTPGQVRAFGMLAGGSGITPMFQVCTWGTYFDSVYICMIMSLLTS